MLCQFEKMIYPPNPAQIDPGSYMIALYRPCEKIRDASGQILTQVKAVGYCLPVASHLPSVGPGAVLSEIIASGRIPVVRLDQVFRQDSGSRIATNAKKIRHGDASLEYGDDFQFISSPNMQISAEKIAELYLQEAKKYGIDNVALLTPYRQKTEHLQ